MLESDIDYANFCHRSAASYEASSLPAMGKMVRKIFLDTAG